MSRYAAVVCLAVMALLLTGCPQGDKGAGGGPPTGVTKTLDLWTIWNAEPRKSALQDIVAGFEAANPAVKIRINNLEPDGYKTSIRVALGGQNPPDIFFVWSGEKMLNAFIRGGNVLDITDWMDTGPQPWRERIIPGSLARFTFDGKVYGIPYLLQCTFFFYNKEIFAENGINIPLTWDDLIGTCETLQRNNVIPIALGNVQQWPASHFPCVLMQRLIGEQAVEKQYDPLGPGDYSEPAWVQSLVMFKNFANSGFFNDSPNSVTRENARALFYTEKTAMMYTGTWDFARFSEGGEAPEEFWDKWDFFNFPAVPGGKGNQEALTGTADGYIISSKTRHPEEAVKFLQYMTQVEVAQEFVAKCKELVQVKGAVTDENSSWYLAKYARMVEATSEIDPWSDTLMEKSVADVHLAGIQGLLAGQKTPEQIMADVRKRQADVKQEMLVREQGGRK